MNFIAFLLLLGMMGTVCSKPVCDADCTATKIYENQYFKHISDLSQSSVAPWTLKSPSNGKMFKSIPYAECTTCSVVGMIAKPIYLQISVFKRARNGTDHLWCRCPYMLAVGCTCVIT